MFVFLSYIAYHNADWYFKNASDYRGAARRGARGSEPPRNLADQLTLFEPGGQSLPLTLLPAPPPRIQHAIYTSGLVLQNQDLLNMK